nr:hypothetical protein [Rhizobium leguminosarum]
MESAVDQADLDVYRNDVKFTPADRRFQSIFNGGNVLGRDGATDDLRLEFKTVARLVRRNNQLRAGELAGAAEVLLVRVVDLDRSCDRLAEYDGGGPTLQSIPQIRFMVSTFASISAWLAPVRSAELLSRSVLALEGFLFAMERIASSSLSPSFSDRGKIET